MSQRIIKPLLAFFIGFGLVLIFIFSYFYYYLAVAPIPVQHETILEVKAHSSASSLIYDLYNKKLIKYPRLLLTLIKYWGYANQFKAGYYQVQNESILHLLQRIIKGDVLVKSFKIIEGSTLAQVENHLKSAEYLEYHPSDWQVIKAQYPSAEGLLLADTYNYHAGSDAKQLLIIANKNLQAYLSECWNNRDAGLPYKNPYELLIVASILEKETGISRERHIISGIVINRLKMNMPLQMDPTVIYAYGTNFSGRLTHNSLKIDSPYNTYRYKGLPPTPIAMVGKNALDAAAHPQASNYLYFVAKGDGSHIFSVTYQEQRQAIERYLRNGESHE